MSWNKPNKGSAAVITSLLMVIIRCCSDAKFNQYKQGGCGYKCCCDNRLNCSFIDSVSRQQREAIIAVFSSSGIDVITTLLKVYIMYMYMYIIDTCTCTCTCCNYYYYWYIRNFVIFFYHYGVRNRPLVYLMLQY